jgi:hypothetical protein
MPGWAWLLIGAGAALLSAWIAAEAIWAAVWLVVL